MCVKGQCSNFLVLYVYEAGAGICVAFVRVVCAAGCRRTRKRLAADPGICLSPLHGASRPTTRTQALRGDKHPGHHFTARKHPEHHRNAIKTSPAPIKRPGHHYNARKTTCSKPCRRRLRRCAWRHAAAAAGASTSGCSTSPRRAENH